MVNLTFGTQKVEQNLFVITVHVIADFDCFLKFYNTILSPFHNTNFLNTVPQSMCSTYESHIQF